MFTICVAGTPSPKPDPRVRDPQLLKDLHLRWRECALCGEVSPLSLHHVLKHPRDDVEENLVMLCGDGTRGCHGAIEAHSETHLRLLAVHLLTNRYDVVAYTVRKFGSQEAAEAWFRRMLGY